MGAAAAGLGESPDAARANDAVSRANAAGSQVGQAWQALWEAIDALYRGVAARSDGRRADNDRQPAVSLDQGIRQSRPWNAAALAWESFSVFMRECVNALEALARGVTDGWFRLSSDAAATEATALELGNARDILTDIDNNLAAVLGRHEETLIQWLDVVRRQLTIHSTPLNIGPLLAENLFSAKESVILTSATLAADSQFDFLRERIGFPEDCAEILVDSPFNYRRNTLLMVPDDLPDPRNTQANAEGSAEVILKMAGELDGHLLVLFTSHSALRDMSRRVRGGLRANGITALAQGIDGTPRQLIERMQVEPRSVLMGTASFWEGVDLPSGILRGLLLCRLPFPVPNDPVIQARGDQYNNPFNDYQVPNAILRFRQGFGRLIRNKTDRGVVVILDRRIQTANYGERFLNALPPCTVQPARIASVGSQAAQWLGLGQDR